MQCFTGKQVCATLPTFLDGLRDIDRGARAAIFSLLPIAAMLVIYLIARRGRVSWEPSINAFAKEYLVVRSTPRSRLHLSRAAPEKKPSGLRARRDVELERRNDRSVAPFSPPRILDEGQDRPDIRAAPLRRRTRARAAPAELGCRILVSQHMPRG